MTFSDESYTILFAALLSLLLFVAYVLKWIFVYEFLKNVLRHPALNNVSMAEFSYNYPFLDLPVSWKLWFLSPIVWSAPFRKYRNSPAERNYQKRFRWLGIILNLVFPMWVVTLSVILLFYL